MFPHAAALAFAGAKGILARNPPRMPSVNTAALLATYLVDFEEARLLGDWLTGAIGNF